MTLHKPFVFIIRLLAFLFISHFIFVGYALAEEGDAPADFLALADIHFDPFIACEKKVPCPLILKLKAAPAKDWSKILALYDVAAPKYRQDSNYQLVKSALSAASKAGENKHVKFVLVLGDFLGHDFRDKYRKFAMDKSSVNYRLFVKKIMLFLSNELAAAFPQTNVYPVVGNNDTYHGDYTSDPYGPFFRDTANAWSQLIKDKAGRAALLSELPAGGYYAVTVPNQPNLRVILLNSVLFSTNARSKTTEAQANKQLDWLKQQLESARENNQKAIIAMHIPTGIDVYATLRIKLFTLIELWKPKYRERFLKELGEYSSNIMGIFAAHLHSDWFQILTFKDYSFEIPTTGVPAISPIFGNNPGFKIYTYTTDSLHLDNYAAFYFPINEKRIWEVEYDFKRIYLPDCDNCPILLGMNAMHHQNALGKKYQYFYSVSTNSQPISTNFLPYFCFIRSFNVPDFRKCIS